MLAHNSEHDTAANLLVQVRVTAPIALPADPQPPAHSLPTLSRHEGTAPQTKTGGGGGGPRLPPLTITATTATTATATTSAAASVAAATTTTLQHRRRAGPVLLCALAISS